MTITIDGTTGIASVDGSAGSPSVRGSDANSGIVYGSDTVAVSTAGSERVRVDSSGRLLIGTTTEGSGGADELTINTASGHGGMTIRTADDSNGNIWFSDGTSGAAEYAGWLQYSHASNNLNIGVNSVEKIRIHTDGTTSFDSGIGLGNALTYAASNTLDDYEEGSWTPTFNGLGNYYAYAVWRYTKIGNLVQFGGRLVCTSTTNSGSDDVTFNIPFPSAANITNSLNDAVGIAMTLNINTNGDGIVGHVPANSSTCYLNKTQDNATWDNLTTDDVSIDDQLIFSMTYRAA